MLITEPTVEEQTANKKIISLTVSLVVMLVIGLIAAIVGVLANLKEEPELIAKIVAVGEQNDPKMEKKTVMKQVKQASAASAASPIAKMIRANTTAKIVAPKVTRVSDGPLGLGEGDFGDGFGAGGGGMGSGASFFGTKSRGRRFLFVLDHSASMSQGQIDLRDSELEKALKALPANVQYNVILFAGGCLFAEKGWGYTNGGRGLNYSITGPKDATYPFKGRSAGDFEFEGPDSKLPKSNWLPATKVNVKNTMEFVRGGVGKFFGTDWGLALKTGMNMSPPPDTVFFMSDGTGGNDPKPILSYNKKMGNAKINTFAMQTKQGANQFNDIAKGSGGKFVIVLKGGETIDGADYLKDPGKYSGKL
ncbi:MAG: VWA domain-containing protein [Verrucomicrobiales bacterium]|nr:VWA domain-containing protein [Verrucomicrobiales bacterium]